MKNKSVLKEILPLVIPIAVQGFMLALVSATDALMLGMLDQTSLSSVSLAGQVQFLFSLFATGISAGLSIMMAQYWGKGDVASMERIIPISLRYNLIFGLMFTAGALVCPRALMTVLTGEPELIAAGARYLQTVALSYLLCSISQIYLSILKNIGCARQASVIVSTAVVFNIIGDAVLIFGLFGAPAMGIEGAALATVLARALEVVWCVILLSRPDSIKVRWNRILRYAGELEQDFFRYAGPVLMAALVWGVAFTLYSVIMGHMGSDAVAAYSITAVAKSLTSCFIRGLGVAAGIVVGNLLGADRMEEAKFYARKLVIISMVSGVITGALMIAVSPLIVQVVSMSDLAKEYLQYMILFCGVNVMAQSINITVLDGIFCSGGDSKFDMIGNLGAMWCFSVPFGFIAAFLLKWSPIAVFIIVNLDEIVKLPAVYARYKKYIWVKNITREEEMA